MTSLAGKSVHVVGMGLSGVSAARLCLRQGALVTGFDQRPRTELGEASGAGVARDAQERCQPLRVAKLIGEAAGSEGGRCHRRQLAAQARRRGVDHDVEDLVAKIGVAAGDEVGVLRKLLAERQGLGHRAVGDDQQRGALFEQGQGGAARGATGSHQEDPAPGKQETEIALDVVDETDAVEVLGPDACAIERQRVGRAGNPCALAYLGRVRVGFELERRGDVEAAAAGGAERVDGGVEAVERRLDRLVGQILPRRARELASAPLAAPATLPDPLKNLDFDAWRDISRHTTPNIT